ncbi:MAG: HPr kinase/phosphorylase [Clostridiales bacterium]|nr:MAG: HPr kinase/phosphorylase [Clostridiales bacterium]
MEQKYTVNLSKLQSALNLKAFYVPDESAEKTLINTADVNRPGLALADFYGYFDQNRIQLLGKAEYNYLEGFSETERCQKIEKLFEHNIPAVIITHGLDPLPEIIENAKKYKTPLLMSAESTSSTISALISYLNVELAPRITRHGVLVEVYGEGILMLGESGVGKSETAMELLKRGHRLVADDAVEIKRVSDRTLVGSSPEIIRHLIELRGIGIVDVRRIFGMGAVKNTEKVDLVIQLEPWNEQKQYDRLGLDYENYDILGLKIPSVTIPIKPGRNLAIIIEVAAMNSRQKKMGYNAAEELNKRLQAEMGMTLN